MQEVWVARVRQQPCTSAAMRFGLCANSVDENDYAKLTPCYGELVLCALFAASTVGFEVGPPSASQQEDCRQQLGLAALPRAQESHGDSNEPAFDDGLESLLGIPIVTKGQKRRSNMDAEWRALVKRWRQEHEEDSGDDGDNPQEAEDLEEKMEHVLKFQQESAMDPQIFWGRFLWEWVDSLNLQSSLETVGAATDEILGESPTAVLYVGLTRDPRGRYRGLAHRPDIRPHCSRGYSAMHVLAFGLGSHIAKMEVGLIKRMRRAERVQFEDDLGMNEPVLVANKGPGGEGSRRSVRTFLYICTA